MLPYPVIANGELWTPADVARCAGMSGCDAFMLARGALCRPDLGAAIVAAHRFIFDSRDSGFEQRLEVLNDKEGVWRCRTTFNCTDACPRGIEVTKAIQEVKRALIFRRV